VPLKLCRACCHSGLNGVCHSTSLKIHDTVSIKGSLGILNIIPREGNVDGGGKMRGKLQDLVK